MTQSMAPEKPPCSLFGGLTLGAFDIVGRGRKVSEPGNDLFGLPTHGVQPSQLARCCQIALASLAKAHRGWPDEEAGCL
jgi:hypothetical protein